MESPPLPENFWTEEFAMVDFFRMQHQYLNKAYKQLKKRLPSKDPIVVDLVQKYVDLQFRLGRLEQLEIEKQILEESREILDKVGLPSVDPVPVERALFEQVTSFLFHRMILTDALEAKGLKNKKKQPKKLYSPTKPHQN